ncbi:hypothetical protein NIASO_06675 [Niabella soli DSM 19437]|uniref:Uncharacterized protein n=1 Tax=Niabella soli DSM 19437 TaxID=929713 RepID=W0F2Y7_9BACT|nr:hypothetical protein NIASO_06675 [Niabella soli DSM 19437]
MPLQICVVFYRQVFDGFLVGNTWFIIGAAAQFGRAVIFLACPQPATPGQDTAGLSAYTQPRYPPHKSFSGVSAAIPHAGTR